MDNKRRNSILKPKKARNPLGDLDLGNEEEDTAIVRARRVSFASSNQVKKFIAVSERNTIWDSTYEESVEGSDNSPFSLHHHTTESCTINKENVETTDNLRVTMVQDMSLEDLDLIPMVNCASSTKVHESIIKHLSETQSTHVRDRVYIKEHELNTIKVTTITNKENENVRIKTTEHQTIICDKTMELTDINSANLDLEDMELSCMSDMNFTTALPTVIQEYRPVLVSETMNFTQGLPQMMCQSTNECDLSMDITRPVNAQIITNPVHNISKDDVFFDPHISFTMPVGANIEEKINDRTVEMDFTSAVDSNLLKVSDETKMPADQQDSEMEFTKVVNFHIIQGSDDHETSVMQIETNDDNHVVAGIESTNKNQTLCDSNVGMDFTTAIHGILKRTVTYDIEKNAQESIVDENVMHGLNNYTDSITLQTEIGNVENVLKPAVVNATQVSERLDHMEDNQLSCGDKSTVEKEIGKESDIIFENEDEGTARSLAVISNMGADVEKSLRDNEIIQCKTFTCENKTTLDGKISEASVVVVDKADINFIDIDYMKDSTGMSSESSKNIPTVEEERTPSNSINLREVEESIRSLNRSTEKLEKSRTPEGPMLGKHSSDSKPAKHSSETTLTPVVSTKRKRIGNNSMLPIIINKSGECNTSRSARSQLFPESERALQTIDEIIPKNMSVDDRSLTFNSDSANFTTYDDTNQLINYDISREKANSDFSKIAMGENASFPKLAYMPLGEFNSNSFHVSLNETHPPRDKSSQDLVFGSQTNIGNLDCSEHVDMLDNTCPPEFLLHDVSNYSNDFVVIRESNIESNPRGTALMDNVLLRIGMSREDLGPFANIPIPDSIALIYEPIKVDSIDLKKTELLYNNVCASYKADTEYIRSQLDEIRSRVSGSDVSISDSSEMQEFDNSISTNSIEKVKTTLDKVNDLIKRDEKKRCWDLLSSTDNIYKFKTMYGTIIFTVNLHEDFVTDIKLEDHINRDEAFPEARYIHKIFLEKLSFKSLQKSLGEKFDIFSLLDYVQMLTQKLLEIVREMHNLFDMYGTILDNDFKLKFSVIRIKAMFAWEFTIDMLQLEPINDKTIIFCAKIGDPKKIEETKRCCADCPNGIPFVRSFIQNVMELVDKKYKK